MKVGSITRRAVLSVWAALAAIALIAVPPLHAIPDDCGNFSGSNCFKNESCINILFYKQCSTKLYYWLQLN